MLTTNKKTGQLVIGDIVYFAMRPDVLMSALLRLEDDMQRKFLASLRQAASEIGGRSIESYSADGQTPNLELLERTASVAAELGWGIWQFSEHAESPDALELTVYNSPFASGEGKAAHPMCAAIEGIASRALELAYERPAHVRETGCRALGFGCCRFTARFER